VFAYTISVSIQKHDSYGEHNHVGTIFFVICGIKVLVALTHILAHCFDVNKQYALSQTFPHAVFVLWGINVCQSVRHGFIILKSLKVCPNVRHGVVILESLKVTGHHAFCD
jgi:hypothetical protein